MNNLILPHLIPSPGQGWKRSSRLSGDLDRPADRGWLGPAARSCCSTSTAAQAQVHCELPNCNSPLRAPPTFPPCLLIKSKSIAVAGAVHLLKREGYVVPPDYTPASFAPDKELILKRCLFHRTFWRSPPIHNRLAVSYCFTIRFCQFRGSRDWDRFMGSGANLFFQRNRLRQRDTWWWHHSSAQ